MFQQYNISLGLITALIPYGSDVVTQGLFGEYGPIIKLDHNSFLVEGANVEGPHIKGGKPVINWYELIYLIIGPFLSLLLHILPPNMPVNDTAHIQTPTIALPIPPVYRHNPPPWYDLRMFPQKVNEVAIRLIVAPTIALGLICGFFLVLYRPVELLFPRAPVEKLDYYYIPEQGTVVLKLQLVCLVG